MKKNFIEKISIDLNIYEEEQITEEKRIEKILNYFQTKEEFKKYLKEKYGVGYVVESDIDYNKIKKDMLALEIVRKYGVIPIKDSIDSYCICSKNLYDFEKLEKIKMLLDKYHINQSFIDSENLEYAMNKLLTKKDKHISSIMILKESYKNDDKSSISELIERILKYAVKNKISDIHFEPFEDFLQIRVREDGKLKYLEEEHIKIHPLILSRLKVLCKIDIVKKKLPQEGHFKIQSIKKNVDFRLSTMPTIFGEKAVIRILYNDNVYITKEEIGFLDDDLEVLEKWVNSKKGLILVTGATGSGKSTTLTALLKTIDVKSKNVVTIEDPVENILENVTQISLDEKIGLTFQNVLPYILRQDPEVIMIGEIRDYKTAEFAIKSSMTGHIVLSTLHTVDAISTISRLKNMNIEDYLIASNLKGVLSQKLVSKVCNKCRTKRKTTIGEMKILKIEEEVSVYYGRGCTRCNYTGMKGRTIVYEILELTKENKEIILNSKEDLKKIKEIRTYKSVIKKKILQGTISAEEGFKAILELE